jgi:hypothetical protein
MPRIRHAVFLGAFVFATEARPQAATTPSVIPADQSAEIYAIYSAVIDQLKLSHKNTATKYLIENSTGFAPDPSPAGCVTPPAAYRRSYDEVLAVFATHKSDSFRLERKFTISKPYEILDPAEAKHFVQMTWNLSPLDRPRDEVDKFRGATDILRLGNIYFNRDKTFAMVRTGAWCGGLCGLWVWRILEKKEDGWHELEWGGCIMVASRRTPDGIAAGL